MKDLTVDWLGTWSIYGRQESTKETPMDTIAIQDAIREQISLMVYMRPSDADASECDDIADEILKLPEIEAGLGLYLASIEERDPA